MMCGARIGVIHDPSFPSPLLLVGCVGDRLNSDGLTVGSLVALPTGANLSTTPVFRVKGASENAQTGVSFAYGTPVADWGPVLALSSPTMNNPAITNSKLAGMVSIFSLQGLRGDVSLNDLDILSSLYSSSWGARFGSEMIFVDTSGNGEDDLLVAAPLLSLAPDSIPTSNHEVGALMYLQSGDAFPRGEVMDVENADGVSLLLGEQNNANFGAAVVSLNDGSGLFLVSAPRTSSEEVEMGGQVFLLNIS